MHSRPPHAHRRRRRRAGYDDFEFGAEAKPDAKDERSVGILVVAVVILLLVVCAAVILRSMEVEKFPM